MTSAALPLEKGQDVPDLNRENREGRKDSFCLFPGANSGKAHLGPSITPWVILHGPGPQASGHTPWLPPHSCPPPFLGQDERLLLSSSVSPQEGAMTTGVMEGPGPGP